MAYRRSLTTTSVRLVGRQRFGASFCCSDRDDNRRNHHQEDDGRNLHSVKSFLQSRSYGNNNNNNNSWVRGTGFGGMSFLGSHHVPMTTTSGCGFLVARRNMSTANIGDQEKIAADMAMEVSEVAVAAADSWLPVAALQHAIDGIHVYTGLNWWASIVVTTLVIRTLSVPLMINQLKVTSKLFSLLPELEQINQEVRGRGMSPTSVAEGQELKKRVYKEHGVTHFTPLRAIFIQATVFGSLFLAIQNMVEKVPSLQTGGISWFIDLTTADSFYILPFLGGFSFWAMAESNMKQDAAASIKKFMRGLSALTVPFAATFPNALLCYWITFNFSSLVYGLIIKGPPMKELLNIPTIIQPPPPSSATPSSFLLGGPELCSRHKSNATKTRTTNRSNYNHLSLRRRRTTQV